jgi:hypothetical protein
MPVSLSPPYPSLVISNDIQRRLLKGDGKGFLIQGVQVSVEPPGECLGGLNIACARGFDIGFSLNRYPHLEVPGSGDGENRPSWFTVEDHIPGSNLIPFRSSR